MALNGCEWLPAVLRNGSVGLSPMYHQEGAETSHAFDSLQWIARVYACFVETTPQNGYQAPWVPRKLLRWRCVYLDLHCSEHSIVRRTAEQIYKRGSPLVGLISPSVFSVFSFDTD
jgi:hypothetical protein